MPWHELCGLAVLCGIPARFHGSGRASIMSRVVISSSTSVSSRNTHSSLESVTDTALPSMLPPGPQKNWLAAPARPNKRVVVKVITLQTRGFLPGNGHGAPGLQKNRPLGPPEPKMIK